MRSIPDALQAKLDSGVTTLCRCWLLTRADGVTMGFTDHDRDIAIGDTLCRAHAGLSASEATAQLGLAVTGTEIAGALADAALTEADLAAGRYDAARVDCYLVDWSDASLRVHLARGVLGEVRREGGAFFAELRGITHRLAEESGRLYTATCNADLGDTRCGVNLDDPAFKGEGSVLSADAGGGLIASGLGAFADGWFTGGRLTFTSGANAGLSVEVKEHRASESGARLAPWQRMPEPVAPGDAFTVTAGCDKRFDSCRDRFANAVNFRGFPHIPGNDFLISYPSPGESHQSGSNVLPW